MLRIARTHVRGLVITRIHISWLCYWI